MPKLLIKNGRIIDPASGTDKVGDILIKGGLIVRIGENLHATGVIGFDASGLVVAPGFIDMHVHLREPGFEHADILHTHMAWLHCGVPELASRVTGARTIVKFACSGKDGDVANLSRSRVGRTALSMALKACDFNPQSRLSRWFAAAIWRMLQWRQRRLAAVAA